MIEAATELVSSALGIPAESVGSDTRLGRVPEWDSLAHMRLVLAVESKIGRQLTTEEILLIDSADAVANLLA